jgi:FtsP/CotA-like multicopper oxidase with cupredoxin domain
MEEQMKRRDFLKAGLTGAAAFTLSGLTFMVPRKLSAGMVVDVTLAAEGDFKTMIDGTEIYVWQFKDLAGSGPGALTSGLVLQEGDEVNVTVYNNLDRPINFDIPGVLPTSPAVSPESHYIYRFTAPAMVSTAWIYSSSPISSFKGRLLRTTNGKETVRH